MKLKLKGSETVIENIPAPQDQIQEGAGVWIHDQDGNPTFIPEGDYEEVLEEPVKKDDSEQSPAPTPITSYEMKTKKKNVPMLEAVITKTARGAYMAKGVSASGNKMTTLLSEQKALDAIKSGAAKQGW